MHRVKRPAGEVEREGSEDWVPEGLVIQRLDFMNDIPDRSIPGAGDTPAALLPTFLDGEKSRPSETDTDRQADDSRQKNAQSNPHRDAEHPQRDLILIHDRPLAAQRQRWR